MAANWVINELFGRLKKDDLDIRNSPVSPTQLGEIIDLIKNGEINGKIAKELFEIVYSDGGKPSEIVNKRGMKQVTDTGAIEKAVLEIIKSNPDQVEKAKLNPKLVGWFVGQVMKVTGGKANPKTVLNAKQRVLEKYVIIQIVQTYWLHLTLVFEVHHLHQLPTYYQP